jgi:dipeptidase E
MGKIIAIGGGEMGGPKEDGFGNHPVETTPIDKEILKLTGKTKPKLLFIPTASYDSPEYLKVIKEHFLDIGCGEVAALNLSDKSLTKGQIENRILSSDAIYVGGGNTLRLMTIWRRMDVDKMLKKAYNKGIVLSGLSAGSICWFRFGNSDSRKFTSGSDKLIKVTGLGFINALNCPHYDTETARQDDLKRMMKTTPEVVAIALDNCTALEVIEGKYRVVRSKPMAKARKAYWKNSKYILEEIEVSNNFKDLSLLLSKS